MLKCFSSGSVSSSGIPNVRLLLIPKQITSVQAGAASLQFGRDGASLKQL